MDIYYAYRIDNTDEALLGLLTQFDFESFEENDDHIIGYISEQNLTELVKDEISAIIQSFKVTYEIEKILPQNWNEIWEASFQPVIVDHFCQIRADFHPANAEILHDLVINPKMAFGTGHHATTYMMIKQMSQIDFKDADVFDFGCGTGILAILASKLGANVIDAIDIEEESYLNTIENSDINGVKNVISMLGDLDDVPSREYEVILANINRNILIKYAPQLTSKLKERGRLLLSGVLDEDKDSVIHTYEKNGLKLDAWIEKDGWICASFTK